MKLAESLENKNGWEGEYRNPSFLSLGAEPTQSVKYFFRWVRKNKVSPLDESSVLVDVGCGTGRHALYAADTFGMRTYGIDTSRTAIEYAKREAKAREVSANFVVGDVTQILPYENDFADVVLDATCSPSVRPLAIDIFWNEVSRIAKRGALLYSRQLILDGDDNAKFLLKESGKVDEYLHPTLGHFERVEPFETITKRFSLFGEILFSEKEWGYQTVAGKKYKRRYGVWYVRLK